MLGKTFRWWESGWYDDEAETFTPEPWRFEPVRMGVDHIEYTLAEGPHAGRQAIQRIYYQRVAPNVELTTWCEESGFVLTITWYLDSQTTHRIAVIPAWLVRNLREIYAGNNQDPDFQKRLRDAADSGSDHPRKIISDTGYFELL
jgi:phenolic acid decarboxylase